MKNINNTESAKKECFEDYNNKGEKEWCAIHYDHNGSPVGYEYQIEENDCYISGILLTDVKEPKLVVDYDGCYVLPSLVVASLTRSGFDCHKLLLDD